MQLYKLVNKTRFTWLWKVKGVQNLNFRCSTRPPLECSYSSRLDFYHLFLKKEKNFSGSTAFNLYRRLYAFKVREVDSRQSFKLIQNKISDKNKWKYIISHEIPPAYYRFQDCVISTFNYFQFLASFNYR